MKVDARCVLCILTGGTLGMVRNGEGSLEPKKGFLGSKLREALDSARTSYKYPQVSILEYEDPKDSSDMGPSDWARVATDIRDAYDQYDGFVVLMGTDTMAYCASALSFWFDNLAKPVVCTGGMLPLERLETDSLRNVVSAILVAAISQICEVVIVFGGSVFRGCRAKKVDTTSIEHAFASPNFPPLAVLDNELVVHQALVRKPLPNLSFAVSTEMHGEIITIRLLPGFSNSLLKALIPDFQTQERKGVIFELYGAGNAPTELSVVDIVSQLVRSGTVVVIVSQCIRGRVHLEAYATGRQLLQAGAISGQDITLEACACKLAFLLAQPHLSINQVKRLMQTNLRGEMTVQENSRELRFTDSITMRSVEQWGSSSL